MAGPGDPLALANARPALFTVLAAELHLERLEPGDYDGLAATNELVWSWFGPQLRWQLSSFSSAPEPMRFEDLEYIPALAERLAEPAVPPAWEDFAAASRRHAFDSYEVSCHGGEELHDASPFLYRFWGETSADVTDDGLMPIDCVVRVCVPESWDLGDFYQRVTAIAQKLRLRWGTAGHSYAFWVPGQGRDVWTRMRAHALRHLGYDLPLFVRAFEKLNTRLRSASWLTWLGPKMAADLAERGRPLVSSSLVAVEQTPNAILLRAGSSPERGDVNRLAYPRSYVEADAMLRPARLADAADLVFYAGWSEDELTAWLRRFERLTS
jgi:hypothetical protein